MTANSLLTKSYSSAEMKHSSNSMIMTQDINLIATKRLDNSHSEILFYFENFEFISKYISYSAGQSALKKIIDTAISTFGRDNVYTVSDTKILAYLPNTTAKEAYKLGLDFLNFFEKPIQLSTEKIPLAINIKGGIAQSDTKNSANQNMAQMLGRALDQAVNEKDNLAIYDDLADKESINLYSTLLAIHYALENDLFYLVYQPKYNMETGVISGVEALLRISGFKISTPDIIQVSEKTGLINQITHLVIEKSVKQLKQWNDSGIDTTIAVNISYKDLKDTSLIDYTNKVLEEYCVNANCLEFEMTESAIIENSTLAESWLSDIKSLGVSLSLDDFGTGYNSLINLISLPFDCIKIDKYFIDRIYEKRGKVFLKNIIQMLNELDWDIVAEGVETINQAQLLHEMNCDIIQGYCFSKPLESEKAQDLLLKI